VNRPEIEARPAEYGAPMRIAAAGLERCRQIGHGAGTSRRHSLPTGEGGAVAVGQHTARQRAATARRADGGDRHRDQVHPIPESHADARWLAEE
jgi:hypothetical protein